ncbi:pentapeptide repeat-containing protein, partial [Halolamina salina]
MGQCRYTFDRASEEGAPESLDGWACPHEAHPDAERCVFHLSPAERGELGVDDGAVLDAFLERALGAGEAAKQFVGAQFGEMDLRRRIVAADDRHPIDLRYA